MSEPKLISPLLDNYMMGDPISEKTGVRCCPALERDLQTKCIVKIISTPTTQSQLDALLLTGAYADAQSALQYFQTVAEGIVDEAKILQRLSQLEGFFPYINWQIAPMTDGVGFDVYMLSEYRKTLFKLLKGNNMTHLAAVNLGLDLCTALAVCRRIGYLYVNLKPENIYLSDNNTWKIGDIGFVRLDSLKYASLPERYRSEYIAPEIADAFSSLNTTLDVYALGLVLYRVYNGNQLPANLGNPDNAPLLPPDYADYEMSEIILKACDPNPENRWQDPIEMGQALVSYMQRNEVNDTPITPAPIPVEQPPAEIETSENELEDEISAPEDQIAEDPQDLADDILLPSDDETAPEQNEDQLDNISVTDEVSDILSQADDLISHPTPDMSTLTENEISEEVENIEETDDVEESDGVEEDPADENATNAEEPTTEDPIEDTGEENLTVDGDISPEEPNDSDEEKPESAPTVADVSREQLDEPESPAEEQDNSENQESDPKSAPQDTENDEPSEEENDETEEDDEDEDYDEEAKPSHWLRNLLIATAVLLLAVLAFLFYTKYYIQKIDTLDIIKGSNGTVTVNVNTQTDESLLTVVCADAYGTSQTAPVQNGVAAFSNLAPGSAYTISLKIDGFHKLTGATSGDFTTPNQIEILQFSAVTGQEDGSVIFSFATKDQDAETWMISYTADDGSEVTEEFSGHMYTIQGLTCGNTYTFTLAPKTDIKYIGTTELIHTAAEVILPEDLQILSIVDGKLTATWSIPDGVSIDHWTVRCSNSNGFDEAKDLQDSTAVFEIPDPAESYTVEVRAAGMSVGALDTSPANAISILNFAATVDGTTLVITWENVGEAEGSQWTLSYAIGHTESAELQVTEENRVVINDYIPNATYNIQLKSADGTVPLGGKLRYKTTEAEKFSNYGAKAADMKFYLCRTPSKSNWSKKDLVNSDYTTSFKVGEKASFLVSLNGTYNTSKDSVTTMFVISDANGEVVDYSISTRTWINMWYKGLCELDIPSIPNEAGQYTITVYMNGKYAGESPITITQ